MEGAENKLAHSSAEDDSFAIELQCCTSGASPARISSKVVKNHGTAKNVNQGIALGRIVLKRNTVVRVL